MKHTSRLLHRLGLVLISLSFASPTWGGTSLLDSYHELRNGLSNSLPGTSIIITSSEQDEVPSAEVDSILHYPFDKVAAALANAENWCQFMPLHFNIKACTFEAGEGSDLLTIYSGRKSYQSPEDSYEMDYHFETIRRDDKQLSLRLHADYGPVNTSDYLIELEALRVEEGTLLHIHSSFRPSMLSSILTNGYLATLGRDKVGFSRIEENGESRLVQGTRGVIERNVMRYHLAVVAFLGTQALPKAERHEAALVTWFRQNDRYPQQLHEMDEADYLAIKRREWQNQQRLQQVLNEKLTLAANP